MQRNFLTHAPFATVVLMMAHELAHVILEATGHPLRRQERAVDVTAMALGFAEYYERGTSYRMPYSQLDAREDGWLAPVNWLASILPFTTHRCGYLTKREVLRAASEIRKLRRNVLY